MAMPRQRISGDTLDAVATQRAPAKVMFPHPERRAGVLAALPANGVSGHPTRDRLVAGKADIAARRRRAPTVEVLIDPAQDKKRKRPLDGSPASPRQPLRPLSSERHSAGSGPYESASSSGARVTSLRTTGPPVRRPRAHVRTNSLPSLSGLTLEDAEADKSEGKRAVVGSRTSSASAQGHVRRSSRLSGAEDRLDEVSDEEVADPEDCEATPVAHRTRRACRHSSSSATSDLSPPSTPSSTSAPADRHGSGGKCAGGPSRSPRKLRNGKIVFSQVAPSCANKAEARDEDDELVFASDLDGDEILCSKDLLRLRRDDLVTLCRERQLPADGTKKDLVQILVAWQNDDEDYTPSTPISDGSPASSVAPSSPNASVSARVPRPPLLAASRPRLASEKPDTPEESVEDDVGALDLDSLGLVDKAIAADKLKRGDKIGSGGFKDVYIGRYRNCKVAIADLRGHLTENDIKELSLLRDLQHPNIVRFIGVSVPDETGPGPTPSCSLVTELCLNGDLFDYLRSGAPAPAQRHLLKMMLDIILGLEYLHTRTPRIIHRDMKSSNVLITAKGVAKINDFGLARVKTSTRSVVKSLVGTVNWQAPELWAAKPKYNEKVDVYAVGLVFWEMLQFHLPVKRYPFEGSNEHAIYHDVGQMGLRPPTATMGRRWGSEILALVDRMWAQAASDRPGMTEVRVDLQAMLAAL